MLPNSSFYTSLSPKRVKAEAQTMRSPGFMHDGYAVRVVSSLLPNRRVSGDFHRDSGRSFRQVLFVFHSAKRRTASIFLAPPPMITSTVARGLGVFSVPCRAYRRAMEKPPTLVLQCPKLDSVSTRSEDECGKRFRQSIGAAPQHSRLVCMDCFKRSARRANCAQQRPVSILCWQEVLFVTDQSITSTCSLRRPRAVPWRHAPAVENVTTFHEASKIIS